MAGYYTKCLNQARYYHSLSTEIRKARQQELTTWFKKAAAQSESFEDMMSLWPTQDLPESERAKRARIADPEEDVSMPAKRQRHSNVTIGAPA